MGTFADFRRAAARQLPAFLFDYIDGGSYDEQTLRDNRTSLTNIRLRQRVLTDVSQIDMSCSFPGMEASLPIALGPVGLAGMLARRGEVQASRAAEIERIPFCLSTVSICDIGEVAQSRVTPIWFQLYMIRDRAFMADLLELASSHCSVLVVTLDMPLGATRYRDLRSGFSAAGGWLKQLRLACQALRRPEWCWDVGVLGRPHTLGNLEPVLGKTNRLDDFAQWIGTNFDPSVTWHDLEFIRAHWKGLIVLKGILDPEDAAKAAEFGVDAIVVSNHGGRQLDGGQATATVLPAIADRLEGKLDLFVDSGIRSGIDVMRMLALGARGVLLGRSWAYALAAGGEQGVRKMITTLRSELLVTMAMTGCRNLQDITRDVLVNSHH